MNLKGAILSTTWVIVGNNNPPFLSKLKVTEWMTNYFAKIVIL
jgi:hypothetical protein